MRVLGLIPARGGSKGVPRKNIRLLGGTPLIGHTIEVAKQAEHIDRIIVSTEDEEIANVARELGAEVPFMRPPALAQDDTPTLPVVQHAIETLTAKGERPDAVCVLQATFPFRTAADVDACIEKLRAKDADCVITVHRIPHRYNPHWIYVQNDDGTLRLSTGESAPIPRRQSLPAAFRRSGSVYVTRSDVVMEGSLYGERIVPHETPSEDTCDIDTLEDWKRAEELIAARG